MLSGLKDVQKNSHLRNALELTVFGSECPEELILKNSADRLLGIINVAVQRGKACGEVKADAEEKTLASLIFFVFIGVLRTETRMQESTLMLNKGTDALNLVFDMVLERKEISDEL